MILCEARPEQRRPESSGPSGFWSLVWLQATGPTALGSTIILHKLLPGQVFENPAGAGKGNRILHEPDLPLLVLGGSLNLNNHWRPGCEISALEKTERLAINLSPLILRSSASGNIGPSISFAFRFVPKGDRKPVPRIDAHDVEVEVNEFLLGENAGGIRVDLVGQMMHRD